MDVSRTKSIKRAPSVPKKDRFGNTVSEFSPTKSKKSRTSRAPSLSVRHRSTIRNQNPNSYSNTIEK